MMTTVTVILVSIAAIFLWKKHQIEIRRINTATDRKIAELIAAERSDTEKVWKILAQQIESLQSKIEPLQKGFDTLKEVDEKITACINKMNGAVQLPEKEKSKKRNIKKETTCYHT